MFWVPHVRSLLTCKKNTKQETKQNKPLVNILDANSIII